MNPQIFSTTLRRLERHKVRFPKDIFSRIPILAKEPSQSVIAIAIPGHFGGMQIIANDPQLTAWQNQVGNLVRNDRPEPMEAGNRWTTLARFLSNAWEMTFSFNAGRYTAVLPKVARDLGLAPKNEGDEVVVFSCGQIFEIWAPEAWITANRHARSKLAELAEELPDSEPRA